MPKATLQVHLSLNLAPGEARQADLSVQLHSYGRSCLDVLCLVDLRQRSLTHLLKQAKV